MHRYLIEQLFESLRACQLGRVRTCDCRLAGETGVRTGYNSLAAIRHVFSFGHLPVQFGIEKVITMIWTFTIRLGSGTYSENQWQATIEIDSMATLETLHYAIQRAIAFGNDHLYEFFIARTARSRNRVHFDDENEGIYNTLESIFPLGKDRKLYYLFDYGDSWMFGVTKSRKSPVSPEPRVKYPRVIDERGVKPEQYPDGEE